MASTSSAVDISIAPNTSSDNTIIHTLPEEEDDSPSPTPTSTTSTSTAASTTSNNNNNPSNTIPNTAQAQDIKLIGLRRTGNESRNSPIAKDDEEDDEDEGDDDDQASNKGMMIESHHSENESENEDEVKNMTTTTLSSKTVSSKEGANANVSNEEGVKFNAKEFPANTIPSRNSSSRKREYNRRKSSDPVAMKKLPRRILSQDIYDSDDEEAVFMGDIDEDMDFEEEDLYRGKKPSGAIGQGQRSRRSFGENPLNFFLPVPLPAPITFQPELAQEKVINSSNEDYETSIIHSESDSSHYHLKWKNHQTHILLAFESLLQNETFCDVTLICEASVPGKGKGSSSVQNEEKEYNEGKETLCRKSKNHGEDHHGTKEKDGQLRLKAHKIVLAACSEYFQRIFAENPCKHPTIVLKDYTDWEMRALLNFMYRGEVDVSLERLPALVKSAESLQIRGLTDSIGKLGADLFKPNIPSKYQSPSGPNRRNSEIETSSVALNLSIDNNNAAAAELTPKRMKVVEIEFGGGGSRRNINMGKPQNLPKETSMLQIPNDSEAFLPTSASTNQNKRQNHNHYIHDHFEGQRHHLLLPNDEDLHNNSGNEATDLNARGMEYDVIHGINKIQQQILPRRKQARPRRRSGDYIAQDLRKSQGESPSQGYNEYEESNINFSMLNRHLQDGEEENGNLEIRCLDPGQQSRGGEEDVSGDGERAGNLMTRLASRRSSSRRRLNHERDLHLRSAMNLRNNSNRSNIRNNNNTSQDDNNRDRDHHHHQQNLIDEEQQQNLNRVLDYTTAMASSSLGNSNKKLQNKIRAVVNGAENHLMGFPGQTHLPFLRGWSPNMAANHGMGTPPPTANHRMTKPEGDSDDGISSTADNCQSPPISPPEPKHFHSRRQQQESLPFPLFGLHPDHGHNLSRNLPSSLSFTKQSPPSPSSFFLGSIGSMTMTPIGPPGGSGGVGGDDSRADTPSTPPHVFSPANFSLQLNPSNNSNHHGSHQHIKEEMEGQHHHHNSSSGRTGRGSKDGNNGTRGSPGVGWPGLPLGPPPIFGRHRAQHSAPRGGPPRAWSNADLTEALHNVWNKKMTTSQASRIFGIPYNSLLMYVRGKYGKSLKLDLLKKGLDQALENSQNAAAGTTPNNSSSPTNSGSSSHQSSNNINNSPLSSTNPSTTSPPSVAINNNNNSSSPSSGKSSHSKSHQHQQPHHHHGNSNEHNNNNLANLGTAGIGHLLHKKSSSSSHHMEMSHDLPPGFNPFSAASIFGEYPNPFPFASALSHILPQAGLVNQQHGLQHHPALAGLSLTRNDKVSVGDEEK